MSKLIIEVCEIADVNQHPNADNLDIVLVKGWNVITVKNAFKKGQKCVYFPPDSILPPEIYNSPSDAIPGRLNCYRYLHSLPKDENGNKPTGARVTACRLRGSISYGLVMALDPNFGDDLNWEVGTDVSSHFNITKYEPPAELTCGDAEKSNSKFYGYTSIEHYGNYPNSFVENEEVIFTEKIHGCNVRFGLILENDKDGNADWVYAAGSHSVRRKEFSRSETRLTVILDHEPKVDEIISVSDKFWKVEKVVETDACSFTVSYPTNTDSAGADSFVYEDCGTMSSYKIQCYEVDKDGETILKKSKYWTFFDDNIKSLLNYIKDNFEFKENKYSIMLYGEMFGATIQDMTYGLKDGLSFRAFDVAINNLYLDYDVKTELFNKFNVKIVPILYRGPMSAAKVVEYTSGPTTICKPEEAGKFKGREGIVISPVKEISFCPNIRGRKILKSVSVDYLTRKNGTEFH
jgi:hypothetical protein